MNDNRIKVAKDKAELVKALTSFDGTTGPFRNYTDVVTFAAALGVKRKKRVPLGEISKREPGPIEQEYFGTKGYDIVIKLLALCETKNIEIFSSHSAEADDQRTRIFEEYANGGLEILQYELRGAVDYLERLLLILNFERFTGEEQGKEFNLSRFIG